MSNCKDSLGDRMKDYENISRNYLTRRVPVIIRLDGRAFHTFTKGMQKPFDIILADAMLGTTQYLCENIQGCVFGYMQSDEITLVLTDYEKPTTEAWFGYNIQKMASVAASMATLKFNERFINAVEQKSYLTNYACVHTDTPYPTEEFDKYRSNYNSATFDARVFSIPKEEVCNCLIWRQQDAIRNSIEAAGQVFFSPKKLLGKSCEMIKEMLHEITIEWSDYPIVFQRGACCYRVPGTFTIPDPSNKYSTIKVNRSPWNIDTEPPIFTENREYIEKWL